MGEQLQLVAGDVIARDLPIEVEQRTDHASGVGREPEVHESPDGVATLGFVEVVVAITGAVVHSIADGDEIVAENEGAPGVLNNRFGNVESGASIKHEFPLGHAACLLQIVPQSKEVHRRTRWHGVGQYDQIETVADCQPGA
jgi:hypothetical protein